VFVGGFALAGIGGLIQLKAQSDNSSYASMVAHDCPTGCPSDSIPHDLEDSAKIENGLAIGLIAAGGAAVVTGSVLLYMNRGRTVYDLGNESPTPHTQLNVVPLRGGAALSVSGRF
jgi:hypothetical protein